MIFIALYYKITDLFYKTFGVSLYMGEVVLWKGLV